MLRKEHDSSHQNGRTSLTDPLLPATTTHSEAEAPLIITVNENADLLPSSSNRHPLEPPRYHFDLERGSGDNMPAEEEQQQDRVIMMSKGEAFWIAYQSLFLFAIIQSTVSLPVEDGVLFSISWFIMATITSLLVIFCHGLCLGCCGCVARGGLVAETEQYSCVFATLCYMWLFHIEHQQRNLCVVSRTCRIVFIVFITVIAEFALQTYYDWGPEDVIVCVVVLPLSFALVAMPFWLLALGSSDDASTKKWIQDQLPWLLSATLFSLNRAMNHCPLLARLNRTFKRMEQDYFEYRNAQGREEAREAQLERRISLLLPLEEATAGVSRREVLQQKYLLMHSRKFRCALVLIATALVYHACYLQNNLLWLPVTWSVPGE